jgi:hypothetical protein
MKIRKHIPLIAVLVLVIAIFLAYRAWNVSTLDNTAPVISISDQLLKVSVHDSAEIFLQGVTATDDHDGDVTASILVEKIGTIDENNTFTVTYAAFDNSGNVSKISRPVQYTDYVGPRFGLRKPLLYTYGRDVDIVSRVTAYDVIDGDLSHKIKPTLISDVPVSSEGVHDILFRITNSLGDTTEVKLPAEVIPAGRYSAELALNEYLIYLSAGQEFVAEQYLNSVSFGSNTVKLGQNLPEGYSLSLSGLVNNQVPGVYPVGYTLTINNEFVTYTAYSKLIVIVEGE